LDIRQFYVQTGPTKPDPRQQAVKHKYRLPELFSKLKIYIGPKLYTEIAFGLYVCAICTSTDTNELTQNKVNGR